MNDEKNIVAEKAFRFSLDIIEIKIRLNENRPFVFANQILRSSTSIGANIAEAQHAYSR